MKQQQGYTEKQLYKLDLMKKTDAQLNDLIIYFISQYLNRVYEIFQTIKFQSKFLKVHGKVDDLYRKKYTEKLNNNSILIIRYKEDIEIIENEIRLINEEIQRRLIP